MGSIINCVSKQIYFVNSFKLAYYENCDNAVAYEIEKASLYNTPKNLIDYNIKTAPQSYVYIKK